MTTEPQLFRINPESKESEKITEVDFAQLGLQERWDIQEWIAANPSILGDNLLIVGKEFSGFDRTNERLDLLAVDSDGALVVIELKRDHSGTDVHWQAIKYASYLRHAKPEDIVRMLVNYGNVTEANAVDIILQHLGSDDFSALNNDQRIILASRKFAPEVTSAVLWLNEKAPGENLVTCVQLTPYKDGDSLYVQASTIIPLTGSDNMEIGVGEPLQDQNDRRHNDFATNLKRTFDRNKNDDVTRFLRKVGNLAISGLSGDLRPDKRSKWAGGMAGGALDHRYYHLYYSGSPWGNWDMYYRVKLFPKGSDGGAMWLADMGFEYSSKGISKEEIRILENQLANLNVHKRQRIQTTTAGGSLVVERENDILDDAFAETIGDSLRLFIVAITPVIYEFEDERNQEDS